MVLLRVSHDASSAAVVREQLGDDLTAQSVTHDSAADVLLVATELVGNAVVHSSDDGDLDVGWDIADSSVIVRVRDGSTEDLHPRQVDASSTSGRGLAIVAALADDWGVNRLAQGKQVWARVPVCRGR